MAETLGNAYVNIIPKAPGIENEMTQLLGGAAESAGDSAGSKAGSSLLGTMGKYLSVAAVGSVLKDAFEAGGQLQQSFGGLETLYGEASDQAKEFAMQAAAAGISANSYAEQAVSFGAALKAAYGGDTTAAMNAANTAILDMADNAAKMGTPLESIQAAYQGFARGQYTLLDNLKLGYGGTKTEMERLLADAQAITGVEYDIENLGDVYDAIHVIQGELGLTGVAANEAATTLSGSFEAMKASWENVLGALTTGEGLDVAIENLATSFGSFADNVISMLGTLAGQLPTLILGLVHSIIDQAPHFLAAAVKLIAEVGVGFVQAIPDIIRMIPDLFKSVWNAIKSVDWLSLGLEIVNGIISGLVEGASALWNALSDMAANAWNWAKSVFQIGSPSKLFADGVGKWIPAGVALGIDDNMAPLNSAISDMSNDAVARFDQTTAAGAYAGGSGGSAGADAFRSAAAELAEALKSIQFDFYMDGKQITDSVTLRQRQALRAGG